MLPPFDEHGLLVEGMHNCMLDEVEARFGSFQGSDKRPRVWAKFKEFVSEAKTSGLVEELLLDGSFVTAKPSPNDIDIVLVVFAIHDFGKDLPPDHYNLLAEHRVRRRFGFDIVVVQNGTEELAQAVEFFTQVRQRPALRKGLLRIVL